jgi:hypothetical protein
MLLIYCSLYEKYDWKVLETHSLIFRYADAISMCTAYFLILQSSDSLKVEVLSSREGIKLFSKNFRY